MFSRLRGHHDTSHVACAELANAVATGHQRTATMTRDPITADSQWLQRRAQEVHTCTVGEVDMDPAAMERGYGTWNRIKTPALAGPAQVAIPRSSRSIRGSTVPGWPAIGLRAYDPLPPMPPPASLPPCYLWSRT